MSERWKKTETENKGEKTQSQKSQQVKTRSDAAWKATYSVLAIVLLLDHKITYVSHQNNGQKHWLSIFIKAYKMPNVEE